MILQALRRYYDALEARGRGPSVGLVRGAGFLRPFD